MESGVEMEGVMLFWRTRGERGGAGGCVCGEEGEEGVGERCARWRTVFVLEERTRWWWWLGGTWIGGGLLRDISEELI